MKKYYIANGARIIGDVALSNNVSIWYNAVIRADTQSVHIGHGTNIQDLVMIHTGNVLPVVIEDNVTIGHSAIIHGCTIHSSTLIGMGAILLDGCEIGECSIVGAGSLVTQGKAFPPRSLILGSPAKVVRALTDKEIGSILNAAKEYIDLAAKDNLDVHEL